jgi:hypothetical protein
MSTTDMLIQAFKHPEKVIELLYILLKMDLSAKLFLNQMEYHYMSDSFK